MTDNVEKQNSGTFTNDPCKMAGVRNDVGDLKLRIDSIEDPTAGARRDLSILHSVLQLLINGWITTKIGWNASNAPGLSRVGYAKLQYC